jgi:hypothetical protein
VIELPTACRRQASPEKQCDRSISKECSAIEASAALALKES